MDLSFVFILCQEAGSVFFGQKKALGKVSGLNELDLNDLFVMLNGRIPL